MAGVVASALHLAASQPSSAVSRILLASVVDRAGKPIVDLDADDFVIKENDVAREVLAVYPADYPVAVLLDDSAQAAVDFDDIRSAVARFVKRIGQRPVALGTLAPPPRIVSSFDDRDQLFDRLDGLAVSAAATLAPAQGLAGAARAIAIADTPFSAIVVVSSQPVDGPSAEPAEFLKEILDSGAIVHAVARRSRTAPPHTIGILSDLANQTRGEFANVFSAASYAIALDRVADRMATEMMIEYLVPAGTRGDANVSVGVTVPGAHARGLNVSGSVSR
jgi:hypothetical protein